MKLTFTQLRCLEVINICDGSRLGYADDLRLETESGCILALIVPGPAKFFGLFGREDDYIVPLDCIKRIGEDIILVESSRLTRAPRSSRKKL